MVKPSKIISQQTKPFENPNIIDIKLVFIENKKTSCRLSNAIRQVEKVFQVGSGKKLASLETSEKCLDEKNAKITKRSHDYKGYASTYSVEILNSLNPELQLKIVNMQLNYEIY